MRWWHCGFLLGTMAAVGADEPGQPEPVAPDASSADEVSHPPLLPLPDFETELRHGRQPGPTAIGESRQEQPDTETTTHDLERILLIVSAAIAGGLGARLLPRVRVGPRQHQPAEDESMTAPDPLPRHEIDQPNHELERPVEPAVMPAHREEPAEGNRADLGHLPDPPAVGMSGAERCAEPSGPAAEADVVEQPQAGAEPAEAPTTPIAPPPVEPSPAGPSTLEALRETRASHSHQSWGSFNRDALPRLLFYGGNKFCQFSADKLHAADEWFVIGDIHGDFYALHTIVSFIRRTCPQFGIIFLGDLIDRGPHPIECLWYLLKVADDHPERVLWLAGNHDVGARYNEQTGQFRSTVEPAEFVADLNVVDSFAPLRRAFGREYIELAEGLPRAALMPDGLLLTHGGFPHSDLQSELAAMTLNSERRKWLESEAVIRDFTHLRITKYPLRRPNRLSISCSYGYQDFAAFKQAMVGYGIKRLVTGHQHAAAGFDDHPEWARNGHEALTLTGFGFADAYDRPESYSAHYRRTLVVGRCRMDQIPEVVPVPVDEQDLTSFFEAEIKTMRRFAVS